MSGEVTASRELCFWIHTGCPDSACVTSGLMGCPVVSLASDSEQGNCSSLLSTAVLIVKHRPDYNAVCPSSLIMTKPQSLGVWCCLQQDPAADSGLVSHETDISLCLLWEYQLGDRGLCEHQLMPFPPSKAGGKAKAIQGMCWSRH